MTISPAQTRTNRKFTDFTPLGSTQSVDLGNLIVTDFVQPPSLSIAWHAHEKPTLMFVFAGSVEEKFKRSAFYCESSSVLVRPAKEVHSHFYGSVGANCLAIQVKSELLKSNQQILQVLDSISFKKTSPLSSLAGKIQNEMQIMDEASPLAIEGYFLEILAQLIRGEKNARNLSPPLWLKNAKDLVHGFFRDSLNLSEIAKEVGVNPTHLAENFRKHFGSTVGEYVRNLRLDFAFHQIIETERPLAEIAHEAGFYDQSHFSKRFKEKFNATPLTIRLNSKSRRKSQKP